MQIVPLTTLHAVEAAQLHVAGQPGTFLTTLGPNVLTALYRVLPKMRTGLGYAAVADATQPDSPVLGFVSATTNVSKFFIEIGTTYVGTMLPPLTKRLARDPKLVLRTIQTATYPFLVREQEAGPTHIEMLSIMVGPGQRNQGIGGKLIEAMVGACQERSIPSLNLTVDSQNVNAQRFYVRHGFIHHHDFNLYGRRMSQYRMPIRL